MEDLLSKFSLEGKVALITGASRGIGEGISAAFAREGAKIVVVSRKQKGLEEATERIRGSGGEVLAVPAMFPLPPKGKESCILPWSGPVESISW